jgi:hypothetical protein
MKFDGNLAWKQASATMATHRELLLALAGVFFFLPSFALIMLFKQPQVPAGAGPEQMVALLEPFVAAIAPWLLIGSLVQALGQLTLLGLFGQAGRPTVGEALRKGLTALLSYILVQLLTGFMMMSVLFLAVAVGGLIHPVFGLGLGFYLAAQAYGRFILAGAVIVLERQMNPVAALVRSVVLTRGNGLRLGNFLVLLLLAFFVGFLVLTIVLGIVAALTMGEGRAAEILTGFFSSAVTALAIAYFAAITVAVYRQLAGRLETDAGAPFD